MDPLVKAWLDGFGAAARAVDRAKREMVEGGVVATARLVAVRARARMETRRTLSPILRQKTWGFLIGLEIALGVRE